MASWTKTSSVLALGATVAAGGAFYSPATATQLTSLGGTLSTTLNVATGSAVQIAGSIQNATTPPTTGATVVLLSSTDGGTTWWEIDSASAGIAAGSTLGTPATTGNYPFAFGFVADGNATLALYAYGNISQSVALFGAGFYGVSFA
jgi:hypothetical protein